VLKVIAPDLKRFGYFRPDFPAMGNSSIGEAGFRQSP